MFFWRGQSDFGRVGGQDRSGVVTDLGYAPRCVVAHRALGHERWPAVHACLGGVGPLDDRARELVDEVEDQDALVDAIGIRRTVALDVVEHPCAVPRGSTSASGARRADRGEQLLLGAVLGEEDLERPLRLEEDAGARFGKPGVSTPGARHC